MPARISLKALTTSFPLLPNDQSIHYLDMAGQTPQSATHPLSELNIDALETQKFDLPGGLIQRSNSTRSTRSDKSVSSTSSSVDNSVLNTPVESPRPTTAPPSYIVLCLWPHATESQISSYVEGYEDLYPTAKVLLLRSSWRTGSPELDAITTTLTGSLEEKNEKPSSSSSSSSHPVLLHLFGHTGALNACTLLRAFRARTTTVLDVRAIVSDTEPSVSFSDLYATLLSSPSQFLFHLLALLLTFLAAAVSLFTYDDATHRIRADLTNPGILPASVRKCFVFPAQEMMFSWCDAPGKNGVAERKEWSVKRTSVDARGRWSGEKERYWLGVEGVWEGGC